MQSEVFVTLTPGQELRLDPQAGAPMDLPAALGKVAPEVVLCGNLDPAGVFCQLGATQVRARALDLLSQTTAHRNYVLSSGCDVPAGAPLANLDAFCQAVKST